VHIGWIITPVLAVLIHILFTRSKLGYENFRARRERNDARYAGVHVVRVTLLAVLISGALCGFAGMMQASAIERSLNDQLSGGLGFTAVITTWLARLSAPAMVVVSLLFAGLLQGGA
jgi:simple sugar transport system permease protein